MLSWQIASATAREHGDQLRRDAASARAAKDAKESGGPAPAGRGLALEPEEVYPAEPATGRAGRRRAASGRRA
jgi:hypothetical protein